MRSALIALALPAVWGFNSVVFNNFHDGVCAAGTTSSSLVRPTGICIKDSTRPGHYRKLECSAEGDLVIDTEYADSHCKEQVFQSTIPANQCHEGRSPEGVAASTHLACTVSLEKFHPTLHVMPGADWAEGFAYSSVFKQEHFNATEQVDCIQRSFTEWVMVSSCKGPYCQCVCGTFNNFRCDCSGIVSSVTGGPAPGWVTQTIPHFRLNVWPDLWNTDIILNPAQHVEMMTKYENRPAGIFQYCGCHSTASGCSCVSGGTSGYWQANGYYPAHITTMCIPP